MTGVVGRQQHRVVGQIDVNDRLGDDEAAQRVPGHIENAQRVQIVEVLGQRLDLIAGRQQHLQ